jgi:hypothetical protein
MKVRIGSPLGAAAISASIAAVVLAVGGCGSGGADRSPSLARVPLVRGAHVMVHVRVCNKGANAFCALELVVVGGGYRTPSEMLTAETGLLKRLHWKHANADTGLERAAYAPGDKLRLTYATAKGDLESVELGWVQRNRVVTVALAHEMFENTPALSMLVEEGAG